MTALGEIKRFLLDMDGTVYLGNELIDGADLFLETIKKKGKQFIFITNNSSKNRGDYVEKLNRLGVFVTADDIFTSGEAAAIVLNKIKPRAKIFLLGTEALRMDLTDSGFETINSGSPDFVLLGFDTTLTYEKLWRACDHIRGGVPYYATHPDLNCPLENGKYMPDAGAMIAFIKAATGKTPVVIGKPNRRFVGAAAKKYGLIKNETAIIGDRLYTDIKTGLNCGITSVLVLSGETDEKMAASSKIKSDYVFESVKDIIKFI